VFRRFVDAVNAVEASLKGNGAGFAHSEHLGYITTCPSNCGTGLRASVMLKLPKVGKSTAFLL
jgi:protein-arginine kinase